MSIPLKSQIFKSQSPQNWNQIFSSLGLEVPPNPRRHGPCPVCGGKDRFRFDNRDGSGSWYCNQGESEHRAGKNAGDGAALVADFFGIDYREAWEKIRDLSGPGIQIVRETRSVPVPPTDPESQRKARRLLRESVPLADISPESRLALQAGKAAVEKYLAGRGLPLLFPAESRILVQPDGCDLIIPLTGPEKDFPTLHVTALTRDGRKRPLSWAGGSCRYALGPLSGAYSSLPGADERISVSSSPETPFYLIGEGLETVLAGRLLSGWPALFAVNANGVRTFLDNPETVGIFQKARAGLAILVDRDQSGTGQKASAALAQKAQSAGIPVLFLSPPKLVKGGEKGADWSDAVAELGTDGAGAALRLAIDRSEENLSSVEVGKVLPSDRLRNADDPVSPVVERESLDRAGGEVRKLISDSRTDDRPGVGAIDAGVGKSGINADLSWAHQLSGAPLLTIAPTRALAEEAAEKGGGLFREGRTDDPSRAGHCPIYPEVVPFSEKWRSVVAHKCHTCPNGAAVMAVSKGETPNPGVLPCAHIRHIRDARVSPVVTSTAAMIEGDPRLAFWTGEAIVKRKIVLDDAADLNDHRSIHGGDVSGWIRAATHATRHDLAKIASGEESDGEENRRDRIRETDALMPCLHALARLMAENPGDEQIRLAPEDWTEFSRLVQSSKLRWMDGLSAEAVYKDREGTLEIPLRTLKALGEAIGRGTAWVRKSILHFSVPTKAFEAIKNGALVLDATPSLAVRQVVEALGGKTTEIRVQQPSLTVRQVVSGSHGKTACSPDSPSFLREKRHLLSVVQTAVGTDGAENVAVLGPKDFVEAVMGDLPAGVEAGWWGRHNRGQNDWEKKTRLVVWGVPQLSPSVAEREYLSDRQAVLCAGGTAWPEWDGTREEKWYKIPGQAKEILATGYKDEFVDAWAREWTTGEVVQAIGRLRAVRRPDEALTVEIHSMFPFAQVFGMEIDSVARADWRSMLDYQTERKTGQIEKGIISFLATKGGSRRECEKWMKAHGMDGIKTEEWPEMKKIAAGSRHEYGSFPSGTTPDLFGKDVHLLIEALDRLAAYAEEAGVSLEDLAREGVADPDFAERCALLVLRSSIFGNSVSRGKPEPGA